MNIHCNAGVKVADKVGTLPGYGEVCYHPEGIANIISLSQARTKGFRTSYDDTENCFMMSKPDGIDIVFTQSAQGLYFLDTDNIKHVTVFVNTVDKNKSKFSNRDYLCAVAARDLLCKIGRPSHQTFVRIIEQNLLPNCPVTRRDAENATNYFWDRCRFLKGENCKTWSCTHTAYIE